MRQTKANNHQETKQTAIVIELEQLHADRMATAESHCGIAALINLQSSAAPH
jgi:hypothetical protein